MKEKGLTKGYIFTFLSAFLFGVIPLLTKLVYAEGATSLDVVFYRSIITVIILLPIMLLKKYSFRISLHDFKNIILVGIFGSSLTTFLLNQSYYMISVGSATTVHFLYPFFVVLFSMIFTRGKLSKRKKVSMMLALIALIVMLMGESGGSVLGYVLALASAVTYAFYIYKIERAHLSDLNPIVFSFYMALVISVETIIMMLFVQRNPFVFSPTAYGLFVSIAIGSSFLAVTLLQKGIKILGSTTASFICLSEPITSIVVGVLFLNEELTVLKVIGVLLIIVSLLLFMKKE